MASNFPDDSSVNLDRLPDRIKADFRNLYLVDRRDRKYLQTDKVHQGDARILLKEIEPNSVSLSVWSPPYFVGKSYESHLTFEEWQLLISDVIASHYPVLKPGGFLVINIADILCFRDPQMPRVQAESPLKKKGVRFTRRHPESYGKPSWP